MIKARVTYNALSTWKVRQKGMETLFVEVWEGAFRVGLGTPVVSPQRIGDNMYGRFSIQQYNGQLPECTFPSLSDCSLRS